MDSSVSAKDEIWFLRVCQHISNTVYHQLQSVGTLQRRFHTEFGRGPPTGMCICRRCMSFSKLTESVKREAQVGNHQCECVCLYVVQVVQRGSLHLSTQKPKYTTRNWANVNETWASFVRRPRKSTRQAA